MKLVLEPIFEADFHPRSYGYRPQRDAEDGLDGDSQRSVSGSLGLWWRLISRSYFTTIPHDKLIILIKQLCGGWEHAAADPNTESDGRNRS